MKLLTFFTESLGVCFTLQIIHHGERRGQRIFAILNFIFWLLYNCSKNYPTPNLEVCDLTLKCTELNKNSSYTKCTNM